MTSAIVLILASLLIIGILRTFKESQKEIPTDQEIESPEQEVIPETLPEPQAEIIVENPPHQVEKKTTKKPVQKKETTPAKKTPAKKTPAKKASVKKTTK